MLTFLFAILAIYRVSILISEQGGPFYIFQRLRLWLRQRITGDDRKALRRFWLPDMVDCSECTSFIFALSLMFVNTGMNPILNWLGGAGVVVALLRFSR